MTRLNKKEQYRCCRRRRISLFRKLGITLLGFASATIVLAGTVGNEPGEVKAERRPKYISNGRGQRPFNVTRHTVRLSEIQRSIPKDAIPALVHPVFITASGVGKLLAPKDRVPGVFLNGETKAYPVRILNWHELVNDEAGGQPILVSW